MVRMGGASRRPSLPYKRAMLCIALLCLSEFMWRGKLLSKFQRANDPHASSVFQSLSKPRHFSRQF